MRTSESRTTSNSMILVPFEPEVRVRTRGTMCANFGFGALAEPGREVGGVGRVREAGEPSGNLPRRQPAWMDQGMALAEDCVVAAVAQRGAALDAARSHIALDGGELERQRGRRARQ